MSPSKFVITVNEIGTPVNALTVRAWSSGPPNSSAALIRC
jgi:hypothetical protein